MNPNFWNNAGMMPSFFGHLQNNFAVPPPPIFEPNYGQLHQSVGIRTERTQTEPSAMAFEKTDKQRSTDDRRINKRPLTGHVNKRSSSNELQLSRTTGRIDQVDTKSKNRRKPSRDVNGLISHAPPKNRNPIANRNRQMPRSPNRNAKLPMSHATRDMEQVDRKRKNRRKPGRDVNGLISHAPPNNRVVPLNRNRPMHPPVNRNTVIADTLQQQTNDLTVAVLAIAMALQPQTRCAPDGIELD